MGVEAADQDGPPEVLHDVEHHEPGDHDPVDAIVHAWQKRQEDHSAHAPEQSGCPVLLAELIDQAVGVAAGQGGQDKQEEEDGSYEEDRLLLYGELKVCKQGRRHRKCSSLEYWLEVVLRCLEEALEAHGFEYEPSQARLLYRHYQRLLEVLYHLTDGDPVLDVAVDLLWVAEEVDDVGEVWDDSEEENVDEVAGHKDEDTCQYHRHCRADLAPGAGVSVDPGALVNAPLDAQPGEDHRLMGAGPECLSRGEYDHCQEEKGHQSMLSELTLHCCHPA